MSPAPAPVQAKRTVALVGRANAGKTSLLMHLTGTPQRPVNFPGTSVERAESTVERDGMRLRIVDLPGIASLTPMSRDEEVALQSLGVGSQDRPDVVCTVLDATKLMLELRLLAQLRTLGLPVVVALTRLDLAEAEGRPVAVDRLQEALGLPVVAVHGRTGAGADRMLGVLAGALPSESGPQPDASIASKVQSQDRALTTWTDRLDALLLHRVFGPVLLLLVLMFAFQVVFTVAEPFVAMIEAAQQHLEALVESMVDEGALRSLLVDGLVNGLGSVLVFIPQIALLIALVAVLEGSGYMARAVFLLDRLLRKTGLTGRSFVPLSTSFACAIPGVLATRILADERDRIATMVVAPLMSCSARLPVYVVLIGAFFPAQQAGLLLAGMYLLGIVCAALVAWLLRRTVLRGGKSMLAMELPAYQMPGLRMVVGQAWSAVGSFLRTAGTVIFAASVVVWALGYFPRSEEVATRFAAERAAVGEAADRDERLAQIDAREAGAQLEQSWLARIGKSVQPVFEPAGFDWRITVGILAAFPARELIVPTLGTLYSLGEVEADPESPDPRLRDALRDAVDDQGKPTMNPLIALALMAFFALCSQCSSTIAAIRRESHSWSWALFTFGYMTALAWLVAVGITQFGSMLGFGLPA